MLIAITGLRLRAGGVTLLDEPTNNLDRDARAALTRTLATWPGTLSVVSHDTTLLDRMDRTAELHDGALTVFGGPYREWRAQLEAEQSAAVQAARTAERTGQAREAPTCGGRDQAGPAKPHRQEGL